MQGGLVPTPSSSLLPPAPQQHLQPQQQQPWHAAAGAQQLQADAQLRTRLTSEIIQVFSRKKGTNASAWGPRIHDFVRKLESELWKRASSKEEYMDINTLELRLRQVAQIINEQQTRSVPAATATHSSSPAPGQQPSSSQQPGMLPLGMIPAPGGSGMGVQQGLGHVPGASLPFTSAQPPLHSASLQHLRPSTPYGLPEDSSSSLPKPSPSGMIPVSSGLPVEGTGLLGSTATPASALSSSTSNPYPALTTSGAPVLLKRHNAGQRDGSYSLNGACSHHIPVNGAGGMVPSSSSMSQGPSSFVPTSTMVPTQSSTMGGMIPVDTKMPTQSSLMAAPPIPGPMNPVGSGMVPMGGPNGVISSGGLPGGPSGCAPGMMGLGSSMMGGSTPNGMHPFPHLSHPSVHPNTHNLPGSSMPMGNSMPGVSMPLGGGPAASGGMVSMPLPGSSMPIGNGMGASMPGSSMPLGGSMSLPMANGSGLPHGMVSMPMGAHTHMGGGMHGAPNVHAGGATSMPMGGNSGMLRMGAMGANGAASGVPGGAGVSSGLGGMGSMPLPAMTNGVGGGVHRSGPMSSMPLPSGNGMSSGGPLSSGLMPTAHTHYANDGGGVPPSATGGGGARLSSAGNGPPGAPNVQGAFDNISADTANPQFIQKQQRWLLFLRHCAKCRQSETECQLQQQCRFGKQLWQHILHCANPQCEYPRCSTSKELLKHHQKCQSPNCPICHPVKEYVRKTRAKQTQQEMEAAAAAQQQQHHHQQQHQQPPVPHHPMMHQPLPPTHPMMHAHMNGGMPPMVPMPPQPPGSYSMQPPPLPSQPPQPPHPSKRSHAAMSMGYAPPPPQMQPPQPYSGTSWEEPVKRIKTDSDPIISKNTGTSLLETFTEEQIVHHKELIYSAQQQQRNAQVQPATPSDACKVCGCAKLLYEPNTLYCTMCGLKIKRGQTYYTTPPDQGTEVKGNWCHPCFMDVKQERIPTSLGGDARKADLIKKKNDEEIEEPWVQCDHCEMWVHQVCGLFNKGRNNHDVHYLCPDCLLEGLRRGLRRRIEVRPQAMLEAKDLPQCELSKYLENRIALGLQKEREARAAKEGKQPHEVPTAEQLTVRVVNSIMKKVETKPKFYETFSGDGYPPEFPYRQRVVLLFQKLDGVDVCIFCMYVQEYGSDCPPPNRNCVYLSYLDSVKYFRPDLIAVQPQREPGHHPNIALRTYVYHQLLIGYLSFVKMLGYEQMYIWACPPAQGDDYILYCHPNKQKTPRSDRLRNWYLDMLRLAKYEGVVQHLSTLWDTYFPGGKDHRMERCSVTHIPYLHGDYWPGEAENLLTSLVEGCRQVGKNSIKSGGAAQTARKLGKGKRYGNGTPESLDEQLIEKLGETLGGGMKDDFIVVHLQEVCTFCRRHIRSSEPIYRYQASGQMRAPAERKFEGIKLESGPNVPNAPVSSLSICEACCNDEEQRLANGLKPRLPAGVTPKLLHKELVKELPVCHDPSQDVENEHFETRESFLNLCQTNHFQFDTLRRAKHSSMMVLYYMHNPHAPAFNSSCSLCHLDIEPGTGWRCTQCADFDICGNCKALRGHPHPLMPHTNRNYDETRMRLTEQERRERSEQLQKTLTLLVHACSCNDPACQSTSCRKVRQLFQHAVECQQKVTGGCPLCKKMWCLLNLHAKSCTRADCPVPRCKQIKDLRRRQTARQEEKRRHQYQAMLRTQQQLQAKGQ